MPDEDERVNHQDDWSNERKKNRNTQLITDPGIHLDFRQGNPTKTIHAVSTRRVS